MAKKKKTVIQDLIEYTDRVKDRDIKTISLDKMKERVLERSAMNKDQLFLAFKAGNETENMPYPKDQKIAFNKWYNENFEV